MESGVTGRRISAPGRAATSRVAGGPKLTELPASEAVPAAESAPHPENDALAQEKDRRREQDAQPFNIADETRRWLLQTTSPRLPIKGNFGSADMTRRMGSEAYARHEDPAPGGPTISKTI